MSPPAPVLSDDDSKFIVPYIRNVNFTGRVDLLNEVRAKLCEAHQQRRNHSLALVGLGGVGKTQLAIEYTYKFRSVYEYTYWINAADEVSLMADLQSIAEATKCVTVREDSDRSRTAKSVMRWLAKLTKALVVVDNVDTIEVLDGYLPDLSTSETHFLITSRNQHYDQIPAEGLEVGVMGLEDAANLLLLRAEVPKSAETYSEAMKIVEELGRLPLAIEQSAAFIRESSKNIFTYLGIFCDNRNRHLDRPSKLNRLYYQTTVATTWRISISQIEKHNEDAVQLIRLLAFLNPDGILTDFLEVGSQFCDEPLQCIISDRNRLYEALGDLERFSLVGHRPFDDQAHKIVIHRLVQEVIRGGLSGEDEALYIDRVSALCLGCLEVPFGPSSDVESSNRISRF
jgi:NB-ARC domain